jgi:hypothetical protein
MFIKYGAQVTSANDGAWSVNQLVQKTPKGRFIRHKGSGNKDKVIFVDCSKPGAEKRLLEAVKRALAGGIHDASAE